MMGFLARGNGAIENEDANLAVACGWNRILAAEDPQNCRRQTGSHQSEVSLH